jgi:hypothetical protein
MVDADGEEKTVRIGVSRSKWRDAEEALAGAVHLEALDNDDNVLRACDLEGGETSEAKAAKKDSKAAELAELARIITASNDAAVARYEGIVKLAFEQHGALISVMSDRLQGLEKSWGKLVQSMPEADQDEMSDMLAKVVMEKMMAGGLRKAKPKDTPPKASNGSD